MRIEVIRLRGQRRWWVRVRARNGAIIVTSETYKTGRAARRCAEILALPLSGAVRHIEI